MVSSYATPKWADIRTKGNLIHKIGRNHDGVCLPLSIGILCQFVQVQRFKDYDPICSSLESIHCTIYRIPHYPLHPVVQHILWLEEICNLWLIIINAATAQYTAYQRSTGIIQSVGHSLHCPCQTFCQRSGSRILQAVSVFMSKRFIRAPDLNSGSKRG